MAVPRDAERLTLLMPRKMFCFTKHHGAYGCATWPRLFICWMPRKVATLPRGT